MRVCKMCNKEYELSESGAGYKYCSQNCSDEARRIRKRERMRKVNNLYEKYHYILDTCVLHLIKISCIIDFFLCTL